VFRRFRLGRSAEPMEPEAVFASEA
jgi:hypothetical protein